jgi:hypothetical protein
VVTSRRRNSPSTSQVEQEIEEVDALERAASPRDGRVFVVFGEPAGLVGWKVVDQGSPPAGLIERVNQIAN